VEKLESLPQELVVPQSAPEQGVDGGIGSESFLQAEASLSAPGGHIDPPTRVDQLGRMCFLPNLDSVTQQNKTKHNPVLSDSGVPVVRRRMTLLSESTRRRL